MEKIIKIVDEKKGIVQCTIADERWYIRQLADPEGLPYINAVPSSSWVSSYYYTSPYLVKWIADKGLTEAERIKQEAGQKGSRVHKAIEMWLNGIEININTMIKIDDVELPLTWQENECFKSFIDFYKEYKPEIVAYEYNVWSDKYAGTVDLKCKINGELGILDFKTSQHISKTMELQISSYKNADEDSKDIKKLWILQLGYQGYKTPGKPKFKLTEIDDKYKLFLNAYETWEEENKGAKPKYIEYPTKYPNRKELDIIT